MQTFKSPIHFIEDSATLMYAGIKQHSFTCSVITWVRCTILPVLCSDALMLDKKELLRAILTKANDSTCCRACQFHFHVPNHGQASQPFSGRVHRLRFVEDEAHLLGDLMRHLVLAESDVLEGGVARLSARVHACRASLAGLPRRRCLS